MTRDTPRPRPHAPKRRFHHRLARLGRTAALALLAACLTFTAVRADKPVRVVSMNLCTDQLAILLAGDGQLVSVSPLAADPRASNLAAEAVTLPVNAGSAEEIQLFDPGLVLAGSFDDRATLDMLRRLGLRIEVFPPADTISDVTAQIRRLGALLGQEDRAAAAVSAFEAELRRLDSLAGEGPRGRAAFYEANGFTFGTGTLADDVLDRAGLDNAAAELGVTGAARLPLETLVMARPMLVRSRRIGSGAPARATETLAHPALAGIEAESGAVLLEERWLVCGTPSLTEAVAALIAARQ